jgi:hypothetical protein
LESDGQNITNKDKGHKEKRKFLIPDFCLRKMIKNFKSLQEKPKWMKCAENKQFLDPSSGKYRKMSKKVENDEKGSNYDSNDQKAWKIKKRNSFFRNICKNVEKGVI